MYQNSNLSTDFVDILATAVPFFGTILFWAPLIYRFKLRVYSTMIVSFILPTLIVHLVVIALSAIL